MRSAWTPPSLSPCGDSASGIFLCTGFLPSSFFVGTHDDEAKVFINSLCSGVIPDVPLKTAARLDGSPAAETPSLFMGPGGVSASPDTPSPGCGSAPDWSFRACRVSRQDAVPVSSSPQAQTFAAAQDAPFLSVRGYHGGMWRGPMTGAGLSPAMPTPPLPVGAGSVPWEEVSGGHMSHLRGELSSSAVSFERPGSSLYQE